MNVVGAMPTTPLYNSMEKCVRCGKETAYQVSTPVDLRRWYVEGSGQLCETCWRKVYEHNRDREIDLENELHSS